MLIAAQFPAEVKKLALLDATHPWASAMFWGKDLYDFPRFGHFHFVNSPMAL